MSLDIYLETEKVTQKEPSIFIRQNGEIIDITREQWNELFPGKEPIIVSMPSVETRDVWSYNITHNLGFMAEQCGLREFTWDCIENGYKFASQLIDGLESGIETLKQNPEHFKQFNPKNGWGDYDGLVRFAESFLWACKQYPDAKIVVSK